MTECMEQNKELSRITLIKILGPPRARDILSSRRKVEPSGNFSFRFLIAELGIAW